MNSKNNKIDIDVDIYALPLKQLKENWNWYLLLGICSVVFGTFAAIYSVTTTIFSMIYIGIFLIILGIFEIIQSFTLSQWSNFFLHLFLGILYGVGGILIVSHPTINAISLTLLLAVFFIVSGIFKIVVPIFKKIPHKGWVIFNGILTLILGGLILYQWPLSGLWVIGLFVGLEAIFSGWSLIMLSLLAKKNL